MWIQTTNTDSDGQPVTRRLSPPGIDETVEFSANGKAQVTSDVGEQLIEHVDSVVEARDDADDDTESESS
jgi:hypothetical protein